LDTTYRLVVEYDGTGFSGFQYQPHERTVAGVLEAALSQLFGRAIKLTAAGRTDAGVHAVGQVVSFIGHDRFPVERLALALNSVLPWDLSVRHPARVADGFSARTSALERTYRYVVFNRREPSAPVRRWSAFDYHPLDHDRMRHAAAELVGRHDFRSFCAVLPERGGTVRTLYSLEIEALEPFVFFEFRADGFLHRMVRIMTGTLLEIGAARRPADSVPAILESRDRRSAGLTAPPQGLCLVDVSYPDFSSRPIGELWPSSRTSLLG